MERPAPIHLPVAGTDIAVRRRQGRSPGIVWLGGYRSDMLGTKAEALDAFAATRGAACLRHDYSGHGESSGSFTDGTISMWVAQSLAVLRAFSQGPQLLVGSSMGAWVALRMVAELHDAGEGDRVGALLLLAPAPDFTMDLMEPRLADAHRRQLATQGYMEEASDYSDEPNVYTRALFEDGRKNRVMDGPIDTHCPVTIIQGLADEDVPHAHALKLAEHLPADDVTVSLVKDGDHRLSRPQDIALILKAAGGLLDRMSA